MGAFLENIWTKRAVSLLSPVYCAISVVLSYFSIFYDLVVVEPVTICLLLSAVSLIALVLMLYSRKQVLTILSSLVMLPALLPAVLFYFGSWTVLVPLLVTALIIFFFSGLGETAKTVFGTISLLLYLLGSLVYFLMTTLFAPSTVSTVVQEGVSQTGTYRYEVINTVDSSEGSTVVNVETNALDKDYGFVRFQIKGLSRSVVQTRPLQEENNIVWQTETRADITAYLQKTAPHAEVTLSDQQMVLLGRKAYEVTYADGTMLTLFPEEYYALSITLTAEEQAALETSQSVFFLHELSDRALKILGITINDFKTIPLSSLTEADLDTLGVPAQGDVMYYNGEVCFRYYIAILEEYFDISKQEIGFS